MSRTGSSSRHEGWGMGTGTGPTSVITPHVGRAEKRWWAGGREGRHSPSSGRPQMKESIGQ